jgi:ABC-type lipoprotein export system ATPase subunit
MVEAQGLVKRYARDGVEVRAVDGVWLRVERGQFVAVRGPSGSGKTTLLLMLGGLLKPDAGLVRLAGQDPYQLSPEARAALRARSVGFVFQQFHLVPYLSLLENVLAPAVAAPSASARQDAAELLELMGLSHRAGHLPGELSAGEQQRAALARALLNRPAVLLADEPTGNVDDQNADRILAGLRAFAAQGGAVVLVTHDREAAAQADRVLSLEAGRLAAATEAANP